MILYFSGTGNTRYCAESLGRMLNEPVIDIASADASAVQFEDKTLGVLFPVYSWGVPPIVTSFIARLSQSFVEKAAASRGIWSVATYGDDTALAPEMLRDALAARGLTLQALWGVQMPNVYVLLPGFDIDSKEVETGKLDAAAVRLKKIAGAIAARCWAFDYHKGGASWLKSRIVFPGFVKYGIKPHKWHWTEECVSCGRCAAACPVGNITMKGGHPSWGADCTSCLACYHSCPAHAVEYGNATRHKGQYLCHRKPLVM